MATRPTVITGEEFAGAEYLAPDQLDKLVIDSPVNAAHNLISGWSNGLIVIPALSLNNTNTGFSNATILMQGRLFEPKKAVSAARFWQTEDTAIMLTVKSMDARLFKFDGRLSSQLLDSSELSVTWTKNGTELTNDELAAFNYNGFCLRANLAPIPPAGWAKLDISIFPANKDTLLLENPCATDHRFPGMNLFSGQVMIGPRSSDLFPEVAWGSPVAPALIPLSNTADLPIEIPVKLIKSALSKLLRTALKPESKRSIGYLAPRWADLKAKGPASLAPCNPDFLWPAVSELPTSPPDTTAAGGRNNFFSPLLPPPPPWSPNF